MEKNYFLLVLSLITLMMSNNVPAHGQIEDIDWFVCSELVAGNNYFKFNNDSIFFKSEGFGEFDDFTAIGVYTLNGNNLTWRDFTLLNGCDTTIVGAYNIVLNADSLQLELVNDTCDARAIVLEEFVFKGGIVSNVNNIANLDYLIYPNPVVDVLEIKNVNNVDFEFTIFDVNGTKVVEGSSLEYTKIDIGHLNKGIYILSIEARGQVQSYKLSKI